MKSHYKAKWIGKLPMCAICAGAGEGGRVEHRLTHGVSVWLCEGHRSDDFQRMRGGRDFVASLGAVWRAAGVLTRRHTAALNAHLQRIRDNSPRERPGSYAWPDLRRYAESRYAEGISPSTVMREVSERPDAAGHKGPSLRTFRRWCFEGRWLQQALATRARSRQDPSARSTPQAGQEEARNDRAAPRVASHRPRPPQGAT